MRVIALSILICFLGGMFVSLHHMSIGMSMTGDISDCPFMTHETVLCPMDLTEHIGAWKGIFATILPSMLLFCGLLAIRAYILDTTHSVHRLRTHTLTPVARSLLYADTHTGIYRQFQELFSNGILHPKLFELANTLQRQ